MLSDCSQILEAQRLENLLELLSWVFYFPCELTQEGPDLKARRFQALFSSGLFVPISARGPISVFLIDRVFVSPKTLNKQK